MHRCGVVLLMAVFLASCATGAPPGSAKTAVDIPTQWVAQGDHLDADGQTNWLHELRDPQLVTLVDEALRNNFNLKASAARLLVALSQARIEGAAQLPDITAYARSQRSRSNMDFGTAFSSVYSTRHELGFDVNWEVDVWRRLAAAESAAEADALSASWDLAGARLSLMAQVAQTWFGLIEAQQQINLAASSIDSYARTHDMVLQRFNRGLSRGVDVQLAANNLAMAQSQLAERQLKFEELARQLSVLVGRYPDANVVTAAVLPDVSQAVPVGLPSDLLSRRPDLKAAEARLMAAGWRLNAAKGQLLPQVRLTSRAGTASDEIRDLTDLDNLIWSLLGNLTAPLFNGGVLRENVRVNEALQDEQFAHFTQTVLTAFREAEDVLSAEYWLARQEAALNQAIVTAQASEQFAEQQYQSGIGGILTWLEAQRRRISAESQWTRVRGERVTNRIRLHLALGGDFGELRQAGQLDETR